MISQVLISAFFFSWMTLLFSGCSSGPELGKYSRREIDRPYTLPKGVASWHIPTTFGRIRDNTSSEVITPIAYPLIWETALTDDWELIWVPVPLGVSHQLWNRESGRAGITLLTGVGYGSVSGFELVTNLLFSYRQKLSPTLAIDWVPSFTPDILFKSGNSFRWASSFSAGPLYQLSETFSLKPSASIVATHGGSASGSANAVFSDVKLDAQTVYSLGLGVSGVWSFSRQWDLKPSYNFTGLSSRNGYVAHLGALEFVHFW